MNLTRVSLGFSKELRDNCVSWKAKRKLFKFLVCNPSDSSPSSIVPFPLWLITFWAFLLFSHLSVCCTWPKRNLDTVTWTLLSKLLAWLLFLWAVACVAGGSGCGRETFCAEAANSVASPFFSRPARLFALAFGTKVRAGCTGYMGCCLHRNRYYFRHATAAAALPWGKSVPWRS